MCISIKSERQTQEQPPERIPVKPQTISGATTKQNAPAMADTDRLVTIRRRTGRGTLRIPLATSGLTASGLNLPSG